MYGHDCIGCLRELEPRSCVTERHQGLDVVEMIRVMESSPKTDRRSCDTRVDESFLESLGSSYGGGNGRPTLIVIDGNIRLSSRCQNVARCG
jgi:hypothetical protein